MHCGTATGVVPNGQLHRCRGQARSVAPLPVSICWHPHPLQGELVDVLMNIT